MITMNALIVKNSKVFRDLVNNVYEIAEIMMNSQQSKF